VNGYLRQNTAAQTRLLGPFVDATDFKTPETALTIANTDIRLSANGAAFVNKNSGGATHRGDGMYFATWNATDTATVGELAYVINVAGALLVFGTYTVLEEVVYDALFGAGADGYASQPSVDAIAALLDTEIAAIKAKTDQLAFPVAGQVAAQVAGFGAGVTGEVNANVVKWRGTAPPTEHTPGYPVVTLKQGSGFGELEVTSGAVDRVVTVLGDVQGSVLGQIGDLTSLAARRIWDLLETSLAVAGSIGVKLKGITLSVPNLVDVNLHRMKGLAAPVDALDRAARDIVLGTVGAGATTTVIPTSSLVPGAVILDQFRTRVLIFDKDTATTALRGQAKDILTSSAAGVLTITALTTAPVAGDTFVIM
jgi:hypothetical protein